MYSGEVEVVKWKQLLVSVNLRFVVFGSSFLVGSLLQPNMV